MKCEEVLSRLSVLQDGELSPPQAEAMERHLKNCAACRDELDAMNRLLAGLCRLTVPGPDSGFATRIMAGLRTRSEKKFRLLPSLAYTSAVLAVFIGGFLLEMSANGRAPAAAQGDSTFSAILTESRQLGLLAVQDSTLELFHGDRHEK